MTRISKYELVTEISMLCDELEAYKREAADAKYEKNLVAGFVHMKQELSELDAHALNVGRKKIFDDHTYTWREVKASRNDETGAIMVTKFEKFRESVFYSCPDWISQRDFFEYFDEEFRALYDEQKAKAIAELKESEAKEGDDE
jgi:hypothetical protein